MANSIRIKRSVTAGNVPATLPYGELAVNIPDKLIYVGNAANAPVALGGGKQIKAHGHFTTTAGGINQLHAFGLSATRLGAGRYRVTMASGAVTDTIMLSVADGYSIAVTAGGPASNFTLTTRNLNMLALTIDDAPEFSIAVVGG